MALSEHILIPGISGLVVWLFFYWLSSYSKKAAEVDESGKTILAFTPALHAYGATMSIFAAISLFGIVSPLIFDMDGAGFLFVFMSVVFLVICLWGLYSVYGGRVSYDKHGIVYHGVRGNSKIHWGDINSLREGVFAQYIELAEDKLIISKGLLGFQDFAKAAESHGVKVDSTLKA